MTPPTLLSRRRHVPTTCFLTPGADAKRVRGRRRPERPNDTHVHCTAHGAHPCHWTLTPSDVDVTHVVYPNLPGCRINDTNSLSKRKRPVPRACASAPHERGLEDAAPSSTNADRDPAQYRGGRRRLV